MTTYLTDSEGKFIPATQRPDGTWRKARRVKDGYVPQEEVPLYESKGKQFALRKTDIPPGMCPFAIETSKKDREKLERAKIKKQEKEAGGAPTTKKSRSKKQKQQPGLLMLPSSTADGQKGDTHADVGAEAVDEVESLANDLPAALKLDEEVHDVSKKLKRLRKKLREIEAIEEKLDNGDLVHPDKDQLDKVKRKTNVIQYIKQLEEQELQRHPNGANKHCF